MEAPVMNGNVFQCKVAGCNGNMIITLPAEVKLIGCPRCGVFNCRSCNDAHPRLTCRQYLENRKNNPIVIQQPVVQPAILNQNRMAPVAQIAANVQQPVAIPIRPQPVIIPIRQQPVIDIPPQRDIIALPRPEPQVAAPVQPNILIGIHFKCKNGTCPGELNLRNIQNLIKLIACPVCGVFNCYPCQTIHLGMNCRQYRARMGLSNDEIITNPVPVVPKLPEPIINRRINFVKQLQAIDDVNLIVNEKKFECTVCMDNIEPGDGVIIRNCGHECCKICLIGMITNNDRAVISCIESDCSGTLQDREIRELVTPEIFDRYTKRSILEAQKCIPGLFLCRTNDCGGMWCIDEDNNLPNYRCGMCEQLNCHKCKAIHDGVTCAYYQANFANETDPNVIATLNVIAAQLKSGEIMHCPGCQTTVERDEGCSWISCAICKTEICWATRGPRWGPKGINDTTGGCKCDYRNGKKCHPDCNYCH